MNYYDILGVDKNATPSEIRSAFAKISMAFHPDYYAGDKQFAEEKMAQLLEVYHVLKHEESRKIYDSITFPPPPTPVPQKAFHLQLNQKWLLASLFSVAVLMLIFSPNNLANPIPPVENSLAVTEERTAFEMLEIYWTPNGGKYHKNIDCSTLSRSKVIQSGTATEASLLGKKEACSICY